MFTLLRYLCFLCAFIALAYAAMAIPIRGRTAYGHAKAFFARVQRSDAAPARREKRVVSKPPLARAWEAREVRDAPEHVATKRRAALLKKAAREAAASPSPAPRARIDERISWKEKNALDELVTSRLPEPR